MTEPFPGGPVAPAPPGARARPHANEVRFAHESERQFARLLDFYGVAWEYEPTEFTLESDGDGRAVQAFRPDFYLPAYDLYIEITTLNQRLVTKKNRKVRRLRELHPGVEVKILYQRDYLNLLLKFGLADAGALADMADMSAIDGGTVTSPAGLDSVAGGPGSNQ